MLKVNPQTKLQFRHSLHALGLVSLPALCLVTLPALCLLPLLTGCSQGIEGVVYDNSVDVNAKQWAPTDTLLFPIHVEEKATSRWPIDPRQTYTLYLGVRYESCYPTPDLLLHFQLTKQEFRVSLPLGDKEHKPDMGWLSVAHKEFDITRYDFAFPDSGDYVLRVWPEETYTNILSVTASFGQ